MSELTSFASFRCPTGKSSILESLPQLKTISFLRLFLAEQQLTTRINDLGSLLILIDKISKRIKRRAFKSSPFYLGKKYKLWHYYIFLAIYCNKKLYLDREKKCQKNLDFFLIY